jgi:hypothetical protein
MKQAEWDKLRKKVYADQGNSCCVCGAAGKLQCHEVWSYDDDGHIQTLMGFQAVCSMCHFVTHFGLAEVLALQGQIDLEAVIQHFLNVNSVGRGEFEAHKKEAFDLWQERSKHEWRTELGKWKSLVEDKPAK